MSEGKKFDDGKPPLSLISVRAQIEEAKVLAMGRDKYGAHNWREGIEWCRVLDAILRHTLAYIGGEDIDPESGLSHIAHVRAGTGFILEYEVSHPELDNRYRSPQHNNECLCSSCFGCESKECSLSCSGCKSKSGSKVDVSDVAEGRAP